MSVDVKNFITWIRSFLDDVYAPKGSSGGITINDVYPVGSIYMSANNVNPSTLFGGTWVQIKDRFLLAKGDTYTTLGNTGGESTHTLTMEEMPRHNHQFWHYQSNGSVTSYSTSWANQKAIQSTTGYAGGNADGNTVAHNNMPPYLVVNVWKRTA